MLECNEEARAADGVEIDDRYSVGGGAQFEEACREEAKVGAEAHCNVKVGAEEGAEEEARRVALLKIAREGEGRGGGGGG